MSDRKGPSTFLEVPTPGAGDPEAAPPGATESWLESPRSERAAPDEPDLSAAPGARRKARVGARADNSVRDAVSLAIVSALPSDRPLLAALWPDVSAQELLTTPPPAQALRARIEFARSAIDAVGRRDGESRARAQLAQRALDAHLSRVGDGDDALTRCLDALRREQRESLLGFARLLAGASGAVVAGDLARIDAAARERGLDPAQARAWLREAGIEVQTVDSRPWAPLDALPGAPSSMDDAALAMLRHPAQAAELVRAGALLSWLRANGATGELVERSREARMVMERGGSPVLAVHQQVWALGRRELVLGSVWLRSPSELAPAVRGGHLTMDDLARAAREGVLGAWLRTLGWVAAAGAADLAARGDPSGLKRLGWSLGEPLGVGDATFADLDLFANAVLAREELRAPALALLASGDLLAWMESLPPALRDEVWIDRLRRARGAPSDPLPLWMGVRARVGRAPLHLRDAAGERVVVSSVSALRITSQVAAVWDSLKQCYRDGQLLAWLAVMSPEIERPELPWPPEDDDAELNALLWSIGHRGMVMEWGQGDRGVTAPADLVAAYQSSWQRLESLIARGFVLAWIERFHGATVLVPAVGGEAPITLGAATAGLHAERPRLPAGQAALKLALLCGLRYLPLDASQPGDEVTARGYSAAAHGQASDPRAWEPLRGHVVHGGALLWLALQPGVPPVVARPLLRAAFSPWNPGADMVEHGARILAQLARSFGPPTPTAALQRELDAVAGPSARSVPKGAGATAKSAMRTLFGALALMLVTAAALGSAALLWDRSEGAEPPQPEADASLARWVRVHATIRAAATDRGGRWDLDGSPPDLRGRIHVRDEVLVVGPCEDAFECAQTWERVRLIPAVPFRVRVDDMEGPFENALGAAWARWGGRSGELIRTKLGGATLEIRVFVDEPPAPSPAPPAAPVAAPRAVAAPRDAGVAAPRPRATSRRSRRAPRIIRLEDPLAEF
ncbi:MAG: hypothetical protein R3A48_12345 [Polyangiales bacterium]